MSKHIWIVNYYTAPPDRSSNPRYIQFAKHFMAQGWIVTTFYANYQGEESAPLFNKQMFGDLEYIEVKAPNYVGNGLGRMKSIFSFLMTSTVRRLKVILMQRLEIRRLINI